MTGIVEKLVSTLGRDVVTEGPQVPARNRQDWAGLPPVQPLALLRPTGTQQVAQALRLCHETGTPVVPQGGLSGLAGAAHPIADGVVLSLDRMNRIEQVDAEAATMTVQAGTVLQAAQQAAVDAGMLLGIDLGARGTCTIGGVLGTNAGGNRVVRYGMARDHVLGLEVVLADGTVLSAMNGLIKNNTGLDLKQLFIGSEGLLGVITRAVLRLQPLPASTATAFCGCPDTASAIAFLARARRSLGPALSAFEAMWPSFFDFMSDGIGAARPLDRPHGVYVIIEASGFDDTVRDRLETCLPDALAEGSVADAVLANSLRDERALWQVREAVSDYGRLLGPLIAFDVGVPLRHMAETVGRLEAGIAERWPGAIALCYGHLGDNNLHLVVHVPQAGNKQPKGPVEAFVYDVIRDLGGTGSAEHGIGMAKRPYLSITRSEAEIATMRAVKAALDPRAILNPGRGFAA